MKKEIKQKECVKSHKILTKREIEFLIEDAQLRQKVFINIDHFLKVGKLKFRHSKQFK